jgi:hypothetical protein
MLETATIGVGVQEIQVRITTASDRSGPAFIPSVGEYSLYTDNVYQAFRGASARNQEYHKAIAALARDKIALDIGTGRDALWALDCARSGATRVYAIEELPAVASRATYSVHRAGLADRVTVIEGRSDLVAVPESATLCVSEIIGGIASSEGLEAIIWDALQRLCAPHALFIPHSVSTLAAAVSFELSPSPTPAFTIESIPYLEQAFRAAGHPFNIRLCIVGSIRQFIVSSVCEVESIVLSRIGQEIRSGRTTRARLVVNRAARLNGLILWPRFQSTRDGSVYDALTAGETAWAPCYVPLHLAGVPVESGDYIDITVSARLGSDNMHPDYTISGFIKRSDASQVPFEWKAPYREFRFRASDCYSFLFPA